MVEKEYEEDLRSQTYFAVLFPFPVRLYTSDIFANSQIVRKKDIFCKQLIRPLDLRF